MATVDSVQSSLGTDATSARILKTEEGATLRQNYVSGNVPRPGVCRWITTTISDAAATQATAILNGLL